MCVEFCCVSVVGFSPLNITIGRVFNTDNIMMIDIYAGAYLCLLMERTTKFMMMLLFVVAFLVAVLEGDGGTKHDDNKG